MITVPDPAALLATLRADGHAGLPDVDVRIGASVLDRAISGQRRTIRRARADDPQRRRAVPHTGGRVSWIGSPDSSAAGSIQLGTGTVRADEETVERAVAEVGEHRLLVSVGSGTLTDIAKVTAQRTGSRHVAVQTACSINGFIADRSVLVVAGAKRTVQSRWPDVLVADTDILTAAPWQLNLAGVGDLSTVPNAVAEWQLAARLGHGPPYNPGRRRRCPCRKSSPPCTRAGRARRRAGRASPIWPGCWRPVDCRWESSVRRRRHRAPSMRSRT